MSDEDEVVVDDEVDTVGEVLEAVGQDIVDGVTLISEQVRDGAEWVLDKVGLGDDEDDEDDEGNDQMQN